jgi:ParB/RepB/Spo0J family partition protein
MATATAPTSTVELGRSELRDIPLSRIRVTEGFNPRGTITEDAELQALAETMRQRGCLQPIRVQATNDGDYQLVAGERRYRAAALAALTEIPASVLPVGSGQEDERLELLVEAMIENELRSDLDHLQRAQGYQAMIDGGLSVRGVAERLGGKAKRGSRERRVREHLQILALPEDLAKLVAQEEIPLRAVKTLTELATIHDELARAAANAVLATDGEEDERRAWGEVIEQPLAIAVSEIEELPDGLFHSRASYPLDCFTLSEKAQKDLAAYEKLTGGEISAIRFASEELERARTLGAVRDVEWYSLVCGQDVADSLAEDYIAHTLKDARASARRRRKEEAAASSTAGAGSSAAGSGADHEPVAEETEEQGAERLAREAQETRAADAEKREAAITYNLALGLLAFKHLPKLKVDERVLRIIASADFGGSLKTISARGARLTMPGWVTQSTQRNGKLKTSYLQPPELESKIDQFLGGTLSASDIAGRAITLIALAVLADENAIAATRRSYFTLRFQGPWSQQASRDLHAILVERIKPGQLPALDAAITRRVEEDAAELRATEEAELARVRLEDIDERLNEMTDDDLERVLTDAELAWGRYALETRRLKACVRDLREQRAATDTSPVAESEEALAA